MKILGLASARLPLMCLSAVIISGCATPPTVVYQSDGEGRWRKTVYSKSYISSHIALADGLEVVVTGLDEGRENPFAAAFGALGPDAETPPASFAAHFRNNTRAAVTVTPVSLSVLKETRAFGSGDLIIPPGEIRSSDIVRGRCSTVDTRLDIDLTLTYEGRTINRQISLRQETVQEYRARMERHKAAQKAENKTR